MQPRLQASESCPRASEETLAVIGARACELLPRSLYHLETPQWFGVAPPFLGLSERGLAPGLMPQIELK